VKKDLIQIQLDQVNRDGVNFQFYNFDQKYINYTTNFITQNIVNNSSLPNYKTYYNAIYIPFNFLGKSLREFSCLYSEEGTIIEEFKLFGMMNKSLTLAPTKIDVKSKKRSFQK
jgi:hypothetical protein